MEKFYRDNSEIKVKDRQEKAAIEALLDQDDIEFLFLENDTLLQHMFKYYANQDKKSVSFNLESNLYQLNLKEFVKFSLQQKIVPILVNPEDIVKVFKIVAVERNKKYPLISDNYVEDSSGELLLDYLHFKKALIRICVLA